MKACYANFGAASALLLAAALLAAALLAAGARADDVTTRRCRERGAGDRLRLTQEDANATWLKIDRCGLTNIAVDDLRGLRKLYGIILNKNQLDHINQAALCLVPTVEELFLSFNKLRQLPVFDGCSCSNLNTLYVGHNLLTAITDERTFSSCSKLDVIGLDFNNIEYLHADTFSRLSELSYLYLNNNKIRFIPQKMFANNRKLQNLHIEDNRITHLPLDFVSSFKRAGAGLYSFNFHNNPWQCACLLELLTDVKRAGVPLYEQRSYDGARRMCVYVGTGAEPCRRHPPSGLLRPAPSTAAPPAPAR